MDLKLVKIASIREHMDAHYRGEISYSKAVDLINEDVNKELRIGGVSHRTWKADEIINQLYQFESIEEAKRWFSEYGG